MPQDAAPDIATLPPAALIDYILTRFHDRHRAELPELIALADKVERVHADAADVPHGLAAVLRRVAGELESHMQKEELVLFPAIRQGGGAGLVHPIAVMRQDHREHEESIATLRSMTNGFTAPDGACGSWLRLYAGIAKLCSDLTEHIGVENDILFPRFEIAATHRCTCAHG